MTVPKFSHDVQGALAAAAYVVSQRTPYGYGNSPSTSLGCAPFVHWCYAQAGMTIDPFLSYAQSKQGSIIARNQSDALARLQAGDLLFYYYPNGVNVSNPINHVNMYDGNGRVYQESSPGHNASLDGIDWPHFVQANRYFGGNQTSFPGSTTTPASAVADTKAGVPTDTPRLSEGVGVALTSLAWWKLVAIGALGALLLWAGYMSVIGKSVMSSVGSIANATS